MLNKEMYNRDLTAWLSGFLELSPPKEWDDQARRCVKAHLKLVAEVCENVFNIPNAVLYQNVLEMDLEEVKELVMPLDVYNNQEALYYLQGFFEISRNKEDLTETQILNVCGMLFSNEVGLSPYLQALYFVLESASSFPTETLREDLNGMFAHEVDPTYDGYEEHKEKWQEIHDEYKLPKLERQTAIVSEMTYN